MTAAWAWIAAVSLASAAPASPEAAESTCTVSLLAPAVNVADPVKEIAFYRDALGMTLAMTLPGGHGTEYMMGFSGAGGQSGLILQHDPAAVFPLIRGTAFNRLVLRVSDLDALAARLDRLGLRHGPIRDVGKGYRMMLASDPEGTQLELVQRAARN